MTDADVPRTSGPMPRRKKPRRHWLSPGAIWRSLALRPKVYLGLAAGLVVLSGLPGHWPTSFRAASAWIVAATAYSVIAMRTMLRADATTIRARAAADDEARFVIAALILLAVAASLTAVVGVAGAAKTANAFSEALYLTTAAVTILMAWLVVQIVFAVHYAHDYYRPGADGAAIAGGLTFPGESAPDYWDFFYFTTSIGAASQTSDVAITSRAFRRLVTLQAVLSFLFNTVVLALAINLAAQLL